MGEGCDRGHRSAGSSRGSIPASDVEGTMRKIILLMAAIALMLCSVEVWAGSSRIATSDDAPVFVISNAL
jgi:hypothetical protein